MGLRPRMSVDVPVVSVGNLTVGGTGKTPISAWVARYYGGAGHTPAIVLRGYGGDEGMVHRKVVPEAIVIEDPDRPRGAQRAVAGGASVIVLDDGFQRLDLHRDLDIVLVSVESTGAAPWTLPGGPWREGLRALKRSDLVVVTRKRADFSSAERFSKRLQAISKKPVAIARLGVCGFKGLLSGEDVPVGSLDGVSVLAVAGVADPDSFVNQCAEIAGRVKTALFSDHYAYSKRDIPRLVHSARGVDYVVVTEKDAVKLRGLWPEGEPEPLVASMDVSWEVGEDYVISALGQVVGVDEP